jgi:hypothetical protein
MMKKRVAKKISKYNDKLKYSNQQISRSKQKLAEVKTTPKK